MGATVFAASPAGDRVFLGGGLDDGVLCDVRVGGGENDEKKISKKPKLEPRDGEAAKLYGALEAPRDDDERAASVHVTATDALLSIGAVLDCGFAARVGHRWPFQPQREGDARRVAAGAGYQNSTAPSRCSFVVRNVGAPEHLGEISAKFEARRVLGYRAGRRGGAVVGEGGAGDVRRTGRAAGAGENTTERRLLFKMPFLR